MVFTTEKREYIETAIARAEEAGTSRENIKLIRDYTAELRSSPGISLLREMKLVYTLLTYAAILPSFREATISDIFKAINTIRDRPNGRRGPYKANTIHDYVVILKQFYRWMIDTGAARNIGLKEIIRIKNPPMDTMTHTAEQLLTGDEVRKLIEACQSSRDRAIIATLYEGGFRPRELADLTWDHVKFSHPGVSINTAGKTGKPRYIRLIMAAEYLGAWRRDYPGTPKGEAFVFLSNKGGPIRYGAVNKQMRIIAKRAGIEKKVNLYIFRHSRITHLIQQQAQESIIKLMMWGNIQTDMLKTYAHLTRADVDKEINELYGIKEKKKKPDQLAPRQCLVCYEIAGPTAEYCPKCGTPLNEGKRIQMDRLLKSLQSTEKYEEIKAILKDFDKLKNALDIIAEEGKQNNSENQ